MLFKPLVILHIIISTLLNIESAYENILQKLAIPSLEKPPLARKAV